MVNLLAKYQLLMKDSLSSMKAETILKKREEWGKTLDTLFDCAAADAEEVLRRSRLLSQEDKEEDIDFLQDQHTTRHPKLRFGWNGMICQNAGPGKKRRQNTVILVMENLFKNLIKKIVRKDFEWL